MPAKQSTIFAGTCRRSQESGHTADTAPVMYFAEPDDEYARLYVGDRTARLYSSDQTGQAPHTIRNALDGSDAFAIHLLESPSVLRPRRVAGRSQLIRELEREGNLAYDARVEPSASGAIMHVSVHRPMLVSR